MRMAPSGHLALKNRHGTPVRVKKLPAAKVAHFSAPLKGLSHFAEIGDNDPLPAQARLARPAADLDGDGEPDLLFSSRWVPGLMAVSGKTGKVLWYHTTSPPVPESV